MVRLTRQQRIGLKRVYDRCPLFPSMGKGPQSTPARPHHTPMSYRDFRRYVMPYGFGSKCIVFKWCGMVLGIEPDDINAHS